MKKLIKVCLIAGIICVFVGGGITAAAAAVGGAMAFGSYHKSYLWSDHWMDAIDHNLDRWDRWDYELDEEFNKELSKELSKEWKEELLSHEETSLAVSEDNQMVFSDVRELDLEARVGRIKIVEGDTDGQVQVLFADDTFYDCYKEHDTLKIKVDRAWKMTNLDSNDTRGDIKITIPKDYTFHKVELELGAGSIEAGKIYADSLELDVKAGDITVAGGKAGSLSADCSAGSIYCRAEVAGEVEAECKAGSIELLLAGKKEDYNYELKSHAGSLMVGGVSYESMISKEKINNGAGKKAELECSAGQIIVNFEE